LHGSQLARRLNPRNCSRELNVHRGDTAWLGQPADAAAVEHRVTGVGRPVALGLLNAHPPSRLPLKEHLTGVFPVLRQGHHSW